MRALLDTHVFLWWVTDDARLSGRAREVIADGEADIIFSVASAWEIAIKSGMGRLRFDDEPERFVTEQVGLNGFRVLPVQLAHALRVHALPRHHRDPFDRLLVAQCFVESLNIVSGDPAFAAYGVEVVW